MGTGKEIVITTYGHDKTIDKIILSSFDSDAKTYCEILNDIELNGDVWVFAKIIIQNAQYSLDSFLPLKFDTLLLELDDRSIQKVLREMDSKDIAKALKNTKEAIKERIFTNMSKRAVVMLKEDMDYMGSVRMSDIKGSQKKIINIIRFLDDIGEIAIPKREATIKPAFMGFTKDE